MLGVCVLRLKGEIAPLVLIDVAQQSAPTRTAIAVTRLLTVRFFAPFDRLHLFTFFEKKIENNRLIMKRGELRNAALCHAPTTKNGTGCV